MCTPSLAAFKPGCMDISGVRNLYAISKTAREAASITYTVASGVITITGTGGSAYMISPVQNSFSVTNPVTASGDANSLFYEQTINGIMHSVAATSTYLAEEINKSRTEWLVEFTDGTYRFFGTDTNGMQANGGDGLASGQAAGDAKGITLSLSGQSTYIAPSLADFADFQAAFTIESA